jgi:polyisoprenoid-binding protein YceI
MRPCILICSVLLVFAQTALAFAAPTKQLSIDPIKSTARFSIEHIFVDRVVGTIPILSGIATFPPDSSIPISVTAILDATRIHSQDPDRDAALESSDYFDSEKFARWTFVSTRIVSESLTTFSMDGMLTIHGVAQPEHLEVTMRRAYSNPTYHAVGQIDRHAFGMKGSRLDPVIGKTAEVTLDITLQAQPESKEQEQRRSPDHH